MSILTKRILPAVLLFAAAISGAEATERLSTSNRSDQIVIRVDLSDQQMTVMQGGRRLYSWPVSTGTYGYNTPTGTYQPTWFSPNHRSRLYGGAPMPWSIFFFEGYAIHATYDTWALGQRASHGCVRLNMENAATLYDLVYHIGKADTYVVVQD